MGFLPGGATFRAEELHRDGGRLPGVGGARTGRPPAAPAAAAAAAGRSGRAWLDGRPCTSAPRHAEILALLAAAPEGLSAGELGAALHGAGGSATTARSEISRLRRLLGPALATRPYRLTADVEADFLAPAAPGDPELLPGSAAPGIQRLRESRAA